MPKSRRGPALFDYLNQDQGEVSDPLKVPAWWRGRRQPPPTRGQSPSRAAVEDAETADEPVRPPPMVELNGDRVRLSLTSKAVAVGIFVGMVVLALVFEIGSRTGRSAGLRAGYEMGRASYAASTLDEIEAARSTPPATELVGSLLPAPERSDDRVGAVASDAVADVEARHWIRGYTYIVAQEFAADGQDDAARARAFLAERGIETEAIPHPGGRTQLITTQGYNREDPTQRELADRLLSRLHGIGAEYYRTGGGYKLEGYFKTLTRDSW